MILFSILALLCVPVSGPNITAGDLAQAEPGFTPADPAVSVAYSPAPGVQRLFNISQVRQLLVHLGADGNGPLQDTCFERPIVPLSTDAVSAAMRKSLPPGAHLEIIEISRFPAPAGEIVFPLEDLRAPPTEVWHGYVRYDGNKKFYIWAHVKVTVAVTHLVALEDLKAGVPIKTTQVALQTGEDFPQKRTTPSSLDQIGGALPRRFIAAHSPIWTDCIEPPLDITKGDLVTVVVNSGLAKISIDAQAETSGRRGDQVSLKNPESGKVFRARIDAPGKAGVEAFR